MSFLGRILAFVMINAGYCCVGEARWEASGALALLTLLRGDCMNSIILFGLFCYLQNYAESINHLFDRGIGYEALCFCVFFGQSFLFAFGSIFSRSESDTVHFSQYEIQIRRLLMKNNDYARLHLVDTWLEECRNKEKELLSRLEYEFATSHTRKRQAASSVDASTAAHRHIIGLLPRDDFDNPPPDYYTSSYGYESDSYSFFKDQSSRCLKEGDRHKVFVSDNNEPVQVTPIHQPPVHAHPTGIDLALTGIRNLSL